MPCFVSPVPIDQSQYQPVAVGIPPTQPGPIATVPVEPQQPIEVATDPQTIANENGADNSAGSGELSRPIVTGRFLDCAARRLNNKRNVPFGPQMTQLSSKPNRRRKPKPRTESLQPKMQPIKIDEILNRPK